MAEREDHSSDPVGHCRGQLEIVDRILGGLEVDIESDLIRTRLEQPGQRAGMIRAGNRSPAQLPQALLVDRDDDEFAAGSTRGHPEPAVHQLALEELESTRGVEAADDQRYREER